MLFLATDRGLWRCGWKPGEASPVLEDFSVDGPDESVAGLIGQGDRVWATTESGRLLRWEADARAFLELPGWPESDAAISALGIGADGSLLVGTVPAAVWRFDDERGGSRVGELDRVEGRSSWEGLEAPYEPAVTALCEHPTLGLLASVSVGGLVVYGGDSWAPAPLRVPGEGAPRDVRDVAVDPWHGGLVTAGSRGLLRAGAAGDWGDAMRPSLPPSAAFAAMLLADADSDRLFVVAAPGPPQTWRGPDGARMSIWSLEDPSGVGRPVAGPLHGVTTGLVVAGDGLLLANDDGELWHLPLVGPAPEQPALGDLPPLHGIFLVDPSAAGP